MRKNRNRRSENPSVPIFLRLKQAAGSVHIDLLRLPKFFHSGGLCLGRDRRCGHGVDHGGQVPKGQGIQRPEILLSDIAKECGDLGIVHNTGKGNSLSSRKYQGMEPHRHHDPHSAERADDGAGVSGVIQKVVGDIQPGRSQPTRAGVQMLLHGGKTGVRP